MAKQTRNGVEYFPLDVYMDDKFKFIEIKYRLEGFAVAIKLYQRIYAFGYWCNWNEEVALLFADEHRADPELISGVVAECLKRGIFDADLYERFGILTSLGIQKRYAEIIRRRKETEYVQEYILPGSGLPVMDSRRRGTPGKPEEPKHQQDVDTEHTDGVPDDGTPHIGCSHDDSTVHTSCEHHADTVHTECRHDVDSVTVSCEHDDGKSEQRKGKETKEKGKEILKTLVPPPGDEPIEALQSTPEKPSKPEKVARIFGPASPEYRLAEYLLGKVKLLDRKMRSPNLQLWAMDIDKMIRLDKRSPAEVKDLIDFAHGDTFWCKIILSADNLRDKATKLTAQMTAKPRQGGTAFGTHTKPSGPSHEASSFAGFDASQYQYRSEDG